MLSVSVPCTSRHHEPRCTVVEVSDAEPPAITRTPVHEPADVPEAVSSTGFATVPEDWSVPRTMISVRLVLSPATMRSLAGAVSVTPGLSVSVTPGATVRSPRSAAGALRVVFVHSVPTRPGVGSLTYGKAPMSPPVESEFRAGEFEVSRKFVPALT